MKVLVSACLLGENCKYNGGNNYHSKVVDFLADKQVIAICPEIMAGMGAPRSSIELVDGKAVDINGRDVDAQLRKGVQEACRHIEDEQIDLVILQSRSPTCGVHQIYDGSFSGVLINGQGLFAQELIRRGYRVMDANDFE